MNSVLLVHEHPEDWTGLRPWKNHGIPGNIHLSHPLGEATITKFWKALQYSSRLALIRSTPYLWGTLLIQEVKKQTDWTHRSYMMIRIPQRNFKSLLGVGVLWESTGMSRSMSTTKLLEHDDRKLPTKDIVIIVQLSDQPRQQYSKVVLLHVCVAFQPSLTFVMNYLKKGHVFPGFGTYDQKPSIEATCTPASQLGMNSRRLLPS